MIRCEQQPGRMGGEFADRNPPNVVPVQFSDIFADGIVQAQFATNFAERDKRRLKYLTYGRDIEQRIRRDRTPFLSIGKTVVEELRVTGDVDSGREPAHIVGRRDGGDAARNDIPNPEIRITASHGSPRQAEQEGGKEHKSCDRLTGPPPSDQRSHLLVILQRDSRFQRH